MSPTTLSEGARRSAPRPDGLTALRRANPRHEPAFEQAVRESDELRSRILATDAAPLPAPLPVAHAPRAHSRRRLIGFSAAGAVLAVAAAVAILVTVVLPGGGRSPQDAYAAVRKAVADTSAAATSGTIVTRTIVGPAGSVLNLSATITWHGNDIQLAMPTDPATLARDPSAGKQELRVVGGRYYATSGDGIWYHYAAWDTASESANPTLNPKGDSPAGWLAAARSDLTGTMLRHLLAAVGDLATSPGPDGSTVYAGTVAAGAIEQSLTSLTDLPHISRPLAKPVSADTPVAVYLRVGSDGLVGTVHMNYDSSAGRCQYTAIYMLLGSTPPIQAPNPATVKEAVPADGRG